MFVPCKAGDRTVVMGDDLLLILPLLAGDAKHWCPSQDQCGLNVGRLVKVPYLDIVIHITCQQ